MASTTTVLAVSESVAVAGAASTETMILSGQLAL
jgi:hypothetical protein